MRKIVGGAPQSCFQSIYRKGSGRVQRVELQASSSQMLARLAGLSFHSISYPLELQIPCPNVDAQAFTFKPQPPKLEISGLNTHPKLQAFNFQAATLDLDPLRPKFCTTRRFRSHPLKSRKPRCSDPKPCANLPLPLTARLLPLGPPRQQLLRPGTFGTSLRGLGLRVAGSEP